ncbi:ABC transporter substrate-binding protein [Corynebacterium crudilactis]|uniref:ABC transporter substrate-binding protein n=1 Tax=Corynebacterium crudilactis TaxID=1652495 RepID=A0A172QT42_9CORY|nr:ABC transporter substrate-binding protein [Corynebacterium crudilactis]ANE03836.1 ABC transporter substrate-binding protein [Corynebacterium crudilactis]
MRRRSFHTTFIRTLATLLSIVVVSSCAPNPPKTYTQDTKILRYETSGFDLNVVELADALGYLENIKLHSVGRAQGGIDAIESMKNDRTDFSIIPFNGLIITEVNSGFPITAVAACSGTAGNTTSALLVRKDEDIMSVKDLVGKKIGMNNVGALGSAVLELYFEQAGLTAAEIASIRLRPIPVDVIEQRLFQGQVDAIWVNDNIKQRALALDQFTALAEDVDIIGHRNTGSVVVKQSLIDSDPEVVETLVNGIARALEFEQTHTSMEVREVYSDYLEDIGQASRIPAFTGWQSSGVTTTGGLMDAEDFQIWSEWAEQKLHVNAVDLSQVYTNEFNPYFRD